MNILIDNIIYTYLLKVSIRNILNQWVNFIFFFFCTYLKFIFSLVLRNLKQFPLHIQLNPKYYDTTV